MAGRFRKLIRATAWLFLAWTAVDLGVPSLCALDQESQPPRVYSSSPRMDAPSTNETIPDAPVHVDDCFCCSHCVNVSPILSLDALALVRSDPNQLADGVRIPAAYPPYHPPRA